MEFVNRVGREKGGVCIHITNKVKYNTRKDLTATANYESCLLKLKGKMQRIF